MNRCLQLERNWIEPDKLDYVEHRFTTKEAIYVEDESLLDKYKQSNSEKICNYETVLILSSNVGCKLSFWLNFLGAFMQFL